jgi:monolysocardiolipin acyltransferase
VARLILESDPPPLILPMFIDGTQRVMPEDRGFPKFLPRIGKTVRVAFGEPVDFEEAFGDLKRRWEALVRKERERALEKGAGGDSGVLMEKRWVPGELPSDELRYGEEAKQIRIEVARRMREEVLKVRKALAQYPEPDPTFGLAETWRPDDTIEAKKYKSRVDGSNISQD